MPGRDYYPTGRDVRGLLEASGLELSDGQAELLDTAAEAARVEWEKRIGRKPFLAGEAAARVFDPPTNSRELILEPTLAALTSVSYQPTGSSLTTLVAGTDFTAYPANATLDEQPITRLRFSARRWLSPLPVGQRASLSITGRWGYSLTVPEDAWMGVAALACLELTPMLGQALRGGLVRWSEKDRSEQYDSGLDGLATAWDARVARAVHTYRRITF